MVDNGDRGLALNLEQAADDANDAEPPIDWETLGTIEREAREVAADKKLTTVAIEALMRRAKAATPPSRSDVLEQLRRAIRSMVDE